MFVIEKASGVCVALCKKCSDTSRSGERFVTIDCLTDWSLPYAAQVSEALVGARDLEQLLETWEMPDAHSGTHRTPQRQHLADALIDV